MVRLSIPRHDVRHPDERAAGGRSHPAEENEIRYLALIYNEETAEPEPMTPEGMAPWIAFGEEATQRGANPQGDALQPSSTATTVRVRDGQTMTTDGPFAETKEVLGGYYMLECPDLDAAVDLAAKIPAAEYGSIEVRPIMELPNA